ncbi:IclR family transcriptional regulator [Acuticoccus sp. I52.16.1]|uniref:IclR family transcriptional regulator n=1 Tax=Acuticoccus sp. I52.16.1 TaxID=2928472 RepID=UPI001FD3369C|nr:IclR family transcriptional regulator [Acuticoccus sp. I52.16.1]UOM33640.1 IclR family transcriptional regulator [Acuticoccus sp. I52.16.1]
MSKGLLILEALAASPKPLGITELATLLAMNKSNVHRLVSTLRKMDYVVQDPDRTYRASLKLWRLGHALMSHQRIAELCAPAMHGLLAATGETVHLSVLDGARVIQIDKVDGGQALRTYTEQGESAELHRTASGKVLLAYNYDRLRPVAVQALTVHTARTIADAASLDAEVAQILRLGYARHLGEYLPDVAAVAAPVADARGAVIAAITVSGPAQRLTRQRIKDLAPVVVAAGRAASEALGAPAV